MCSIENINVLNLGQFEEENARTVNIDVTKWLLPDTTFSIIVRRPTETEDYFAENVVVDEDGILTWTPSLYDMSIQGSGQVTIVRFGNNNIKKTGIIRTIINSSLPTGASPVHPQPVPSWLTEVLEKADEILDSRVESFNINEQGHLIATLEDGTTQDLGNISGVSSVNGQTGTVILTANDVDAYSKSEANTKLAEKQNVIDSNNKLPYALISGTPTIPTKTSDLTNDSGFITNAVNNLINYYLKSETYNKTEINSLISQIQTSHFETVAVLPTVGERNVIYLLRRQITETGNIYDEYIYVSDAWEKIGSTDVDLTGYATETWVNTQIAGFLTQSQIEGLISTALENYYTKSEVDTALGNKENTSNKVTSLSSQSTDTQYPSAKCVYDNLDTKQNVIDSTHKLDYSLLDNTPTIPTVDQTYDDTSANAQSGVAVASAISTKQNLIDNTITGTVSATTVGVDTTVTQGSSNLITSGAVYSVVGDIESLLAALR